MRNLLGYVKEHGLSMSQAAAIFKIRGDGTCGVNDIGEDLQITSAAASQLLDRLVQQGFIARNENPEDRRGKILSLTEKGAAFIQGSGNARILWVEKLVDSLASDERVVVEKAVRILVEKAGIQEKGQTVKC